MAINYGTSAGVTNTNSGSYERVYVQGSKGNVIKEFKKYAREEMVTESLPENAVLPSIAATPTTFQGYELRISNTDFTREFYTVVTFKQIP